MNAMNQVSWRTRVRKSLAFRISRAGEKLGIHKLTYNPLIMLEFHEHGVREAPKVADAFRQVFPAAQQLFDVGSGTGAFAAEFVRRGYGVVAMEHSNYGRKIATRHGVRCEDFDLTKEPPTVVSGTPDLAYCFEVAEHLPPTLGSRLVQFLSTLNTTVVFTAAHPGQGGIGHINEQPKEYWIREFQRHGLDLEPHKSARLVGAFQQSGTAFWFIVNAMVFVRRST